MQRIDVGALPPLATERLVMSVLGEGVSASLLDRIWELSRGNALFVRELVTTAQERRALGADTPLAITGGGLQARLRDLVDERLRLLPPGPRAALEVVAVGEQVPLVAADRILAAEDVEQLEVRGLVEVAEAGGVEVLQVVHPLYGEVLAAGLSRLRRRAVLQALVSAVEGLEHVDRLRMATWQLDSGEPGDPDLLLTLAGEAVGRLDHVLAERLARAAGGSDRVDAGLVLAEALAGQGRGADSQAVLDGLSPEDPESVARVAVERASNLFLRLDRSPDAFAVLAEAERALEGHPAWQAECRSVGAQMSMFSFRYDEAGETAARVLDDPGAPETARIRATPVVVTVWGAKGRLDESLALLDARLEAAARRHRRAVPFGEVQLAMARFQVLYWWGDAHRLDAYTADDLGLRVDRQPRSLRGIVAGFRGGALLARGRASEALAALQRSSRALSEHDWFAQRPLAEAMRARAAVFACDLKLAGEAIAAADAAYAADPQRGARTLPYIELSRAWMRAADGAPAEAGDRCVALGLMLEGTAGPVAVEVLHAAARLGRAEIAEPALQRLAGVVGGPFAPLAAQHAAAAARADADGLAAAGAGFERLGCDLLAAEAWRAAEVLFQGAGRGVPAADARRRADDLLGRCGSPCSPALARPMPGGEELTQRELEVATLAARGRTSPEIAEALHLSVRTVDTHLSRVYRKLLITGRRELAAALGLDRG